ncbi:MAG: PAS domain-containing protein [Spirochaetales bacterium]|nr:PAS domain-containing protein [Spirochaetales bacterium]
MNNGSLGNGNLNQKMDIDHIDEVFIISFALDEKSCVVYADENFSKICGCFVDEILGQPINDYLYSYLVEYLIKQEMTLLELARQKFPSHLEIDFVSRKTNERKTFICEFRMSRYLKKMGWQVLVIGRDAEKEKLLNRLIEFQVESSNQLLSGNFDMFITLDDKKLIKTINRCCEKELGLKKTEILGQDIRTILANQNDIDSLNQAFMQVSALQNVYNLRIDLKIRDKSIPTLVNVRALMDNFNNDIGYALVLRNIEKELAMEATLGGIERMQALGELAAGTAHQISNYLNAISGRVALLEVDLQTNPGSNDLRKSLLPYVNDIRSTMNRLSELTKHLTMYARAQQAPVISLGNANDIILQVAVLVKDTVKSRNAEIVLNLSKEIPLVYYSPIHLEQVILNLVMNSIDAMPEKNGRIEIVTRQVDNWVSIEVKDNGCGIPDEIKPSIFKAFVTSKPVGIGTGLGLAIAKQVISSIKGVIEVESEPGKGTVMIIRIPISRKRKIIV